MLRAIHGNRAEVLLGALAEALPALDPFAPQTIVVGSHLVGRWIARELAFHRGIATGLELVTFDRFVERVWGGVAEREQIAALDRRQLAAAIASVLADAEAVRRMPAVQAYLAAAPDAGDRAGPRRVQLADHLAYLYWSYAMTRPEWMPALLAGRVPGEIEAGAASGARGADLAMATWQARLLGEALGRLGVVERPVVPTPMLPWARRRAGHATPVLPGQVSVFGFTFFARAQIEALSDLGQTTDVAIYLLDPCRVLWDDVGGRKQAAAQAAAAASADARRATRVVEDPAQLAGLFEDEDRSRPTDEEGVDEDRSGPGDREDHVHAVHADEERSRHIDREDRPADRAAFASAFDEAARDDLGDGLEADPLPLVLWGKPVRDTLAAIVQRTGGDLDARFSDEDEVVPDTARARLLADALDRRAPTRAPDGETPAGIAVHACPNARREIEVAADELRRAIDADPTLRAHECAVWIAGDPDRYLAQTASAFEAVGIPCHLVDAPIDDRGRIAEAVLALLELPTSTMARRDLLRVMTHPAVVSRFPHVDAEDWVTWTDRLGIAHGADGRAFDGTYLEEHRGQFHWDQGVRRLALGAFMVGDRAARGPVRIAELEVVPEEVPPDRQASAATFALLVRSLCADAAWLANLEVPLREWAELFVGLVDSYLHVANRERGDVDTSRDIERTRAMLASLAHLDRDDRRLGFREAREHAVQRLSSARTNRGEPLASGVMISPLSAMHAVPSRVTFVVGLDEGAFPAGDQPSPLDLRREARAGDVSPRDRDRAAFLEVLLGARDALHLSYVAVEAKSGQPLGPSSVVLELADALAPYLGAGSSREALARITQAHPLHRFSPAATTGGSPPPLGTIIPTARRERWAIEVRDAIRDHLRAGGNAVPDEDGMQALLDDPSLAPLRDELGLADPPPAGRDRVRSRPLTISNLRTFLEYPIQAWTSAVLGLEELPDDAAVESSEEPFQLGRAERAVMLREVFAANLRDPGAGLAERYDAEVKNRMLRGQFPVGVFAEAARVVDLRVLENWRAALGVIVPIGPVTPAAAPAALPANVISIMPALIARGIVPPAPQPHAISIGGQQLAAGGSATRFGFGKASSPGAALVPPIELELSGGRIVRLVGQTELLLRAGTSHTSIITMIRTLKKKSHYHLRGAFDHLVLAAAGLAPDGHAHQLIDQDGKHILVRHAPWTQAAARAYLAALATELLDQPHGYLLPFDNLVRALGTRPSALPARALFAGGDPTAGLGFGPIARRDGVVGPTGAEAAAIAHRRLGPLVRRMIGTDHGFEVAS